MNNPLKKYIYISLTLHLVIFIVLFLLMGNDTIKQPFVVFGAYSKKPAQTLYKTQRKAIPFIAHNSPKPGNPGHGKAGYGNGKSGKSISCAKSKHLGLNPKIGKRAKGSGKKISQGPLKKNTPRNKPGTALVQEMASKKIIKNNLYQEKLTEKQFEQELKKMEREAQKEIAEAEKRKKAEIKNKEIESKQEENVPVPTPEINKENANTEKEISQDIQPEQNENDSSAVSDTPDESEAKDTTIQNETDLSNSGEFIFTLSGENDKKFETYQKCLQQEVQRLWTPPIGVPKGTTCRIKFIIDQNGKVFNFENIKKSKVLIYDLSILRIAHLFKFDKCLWGKSFIIDFCQ